MNRNSQPALRLLPLQPWSPDHGTSAGFDLTRSDPAAFLGLQRKLTEGNGVASGGDTAHTASLLFAEFDSFGTQHDLGLRFNPRLSGLRTVGAYDRPDGGDWLPPGSAAGSRRSKLLP